MVVDSARRHPGASLRELLRNDLSDGIKALGIELQTTQVDALLTLIDLLTRWNHVYNLTSVRDPRDMLAVHLLDSLSILDLVKVTAQGSVLDVGTGPGFPGLPLAIAMPDTRFDLVDAVGKKVSFLQQARSALALANVHPHHTRVEALALPHKPTVIVSRAYSDLNNMLRSIDELAGADCTVIAMKGALPTDEIAAIPVTWTVTETRPLDVPMLGAQRCAVVLRRRIEILS